MSADGQTVLSVTRLANLVSDISADDNGNLYVACGTDGLIKLNSTATTLIWKKTVSGKYNYRTDAGPSGNVAALFTTETNMDEARHSNGEVKVYSSTGSQTGSYLTGNQYSTDICIHEASQTVIVLGYKNFTTLGEPGGGYFPVDVPWYKGYSYTGTVKYQGYDWAASETDPRWLNKAENNMADSRGARCDIGEDGKLYMLFETDGGNHPFRYLPFDNVTEANIVGGDSYSNFFSTNTEPKIFVGRYEPANGAYILGQQITNRLPNGFGNTIRTKNGAVAADALGRVYIGASAAFGMPINLEYIPGGYTGGAALFMLSADFRERDMVTRYNTDGFSHALAVRDNKIVIGGSTKQTNQFVYQAVQSTRSGTADGWFTVANYDGLSGFNKNGVHPRLVFDASMVATLQSRRTVEPYKSMYNYMVANLNSNDIVNTASVDPIGQASVKAQMAAFLYLVTGNDSYAQQAKTIINERITDNSGSYAWADASVKGLNLYWIGVRAAMTYDWCYNAPSWQDEAWRYKVSLALKNMAVVIDENGGAEQAQDVANNWRGSRPASAGLIYLATDHTFDESRIASNYDKVMTYINANLGGAGTSGWNLEGQNYLFYPWGTFIGPFGMAAARFDASLDLRNVPQVQQTYWSSYASASNAIDLHDLGGLRPDWSDDHPLLNGEGVFGQAFYYGKSTHIAGMKHWYDRIQGSLNPHRSIWDGARGGTIWSYLHYPANTTAANPITNSSLDR